MSGANGSNRIAELRAAKGKTQQLLAHELSVNQATVRRWERGDGYPPVAKLFEMATLLETSVDYMMCREDERAA